MRRALPALTAATALLFGAGDRTIETAALDYLLPYWMGRYYGVITQ